MTEEQKTLDAIKKLEEMRPDISQIMGAMDGACTTGYNQAIQDAIAECYKVRPEVMFGVSDSDPSLIQHKKVNEIISKLQQLKK